MISDQLKAAIRDVPDFPKPGIMFKDITPVFLDPVLCGEITKAMKELVSHLSIDAVVSIESRGFMFGFMLAQAMNVPFVPVRKVGKLPYETVTQQYELEYGFAEVEMHVDAIRSGWKVLIHDDLLATGGTASATAQLVERMGGSVSAFVFLIHLSFLSGNSKLVAFSEHTYSLAEY
ncbi:MAG: adenine phosphoribosyltransferase [Flavobacteriales bacterium]|nr:adenine phosphoribosyltransferase [Flavobacteriales bacterium]